MRKLLLILALFSAVSCISQPTFFWTHRGKNVAVEIDYYGNSTVATPIYVGNEITGQTFSCVASKIVDSVQFDVYRSGSPTGNCYAFIYAHSGTWGSTGIPTGSVLATSNAIDVSTLPITATSKTFKFSAGNKIRLTANTKYCLGLRSANGNASNCIYLRYDNVTISHAGNLFGTTDDGATWWYSASNDGKFYLYGH